MEEECIVKGSYPLKGVIFMSSLGTSERPLRVAVVGSGPSGFYAAETLLGKDRHVQVDMFDRLPVPFGLVRYGVAPDHQNIKNVIKVYEKTAQQEGFAFYGNVHVGKDVPVSDLKKFYDAMIFCCGAETDRKLGIPGEDLKGSYTATEFVGWYNGHPDYRDREFDLSQEVAVVIGQGNVAMDVARILCKTVDELKATDIARYALDALAESKMREIHLVGRRGPVQAAFTPPEIKEFGELADCDVFVGKEDLELNEASRRELDSPENKKAQKNYEVLTEFAGRSPSGKRKKFIVRFYESPLELAGEGQVQKVIFGKNELRGEPGSQKARLTEERQEFPCGLFFRSVGYHGLSIPGVPFEEKRGVFPNEQGRIVQNGEPVPGLYCAGWIKRGPSGVIGTNKPDSQETVGCLLEDLEKLPAAEVPDSQKMLQFLAGKTAKVVNFEDWRRIDTAEIERGRQAGKPREKFAAIQDMLKVIEEKV